jgi:hypothetical protein
LDEHWLVDQVLSHGASRIDAATRAPLSHPDGRVAPLTRDVIDRAQIRSALEQIVPAILSPATLASRRAVSPSEQRQARGEA